MIFVVLFWIDNFRVSFCILDFFSWNCRSLKILPGGRGVVRSPIYRG